MKKKALAIWIMAILLTGCGSTAGSSGGGTPDAALSSQAVAESKQEENSKKKKSSAALKVEEYYNWKGIDMPVPLGWELDDIIERTGLFCMTGGSESDPVHYGIDYRYNEEFQDESKGHTLEELPKKLLFNMDIFLNRRCNRSTNNDFSRVAVDSSTEEQFLGFPVLCRAGTFNTYDGETTQTIHYKAYYAYLDFPDSDQKHVPSFWVAFTQSDDKDALDLMNQVADAPMKLAKLHEE